jgi:alcohol dehydrogenase
MDLSRSSEMKAWLLERPGLPLELREVERPQPRAGAVLVRMEAVPLLGYTRAYLEGKLPYACPPGPFTPGTNGIGRVEATGPGVAGVSAGQRVAVNPYWIAGEAAREPAQMLIGLTGISADSAPYLAQFPHGTWREFAEMPASTVIPLDVPGRALDVDPARFSALAKFAVPFGGLRRGRLAAGETVAVNGASGSFGSAAVLAALAMGASKVIAIGRRRAPLEALAAKAGGRVEPVALTGDKETDTRAIRAAAGGGVDLAFDMLGQASDPCATLATLESLARNGRLVLMGSMTVPLPVPYGLVMRNNWEVIGHFMYSTADYHALIALAGSGQLPLDAIEARTFPFADLEAAIDHAATMEGLQSTVLLF